MFLPWFVFWAPQYHFPWSGSVAQQIEPTLGAFFNAIPSSAGDKDVERQAFEIASYGKQLGWLTDALLGLPESAEVTDPKAKKALKKLAKTREAVEEVKQRKCQAEMDRVMQTLEAMRLQRPAAFDALVMRFDQYKKDLESKGRAEA